MSGRTTRPPHKPPPGGKVWRSWALVVLTAPGLTFAATVAGPSFDCRKASTDVERHICAHAELARLDRSLASLWRRYAAVFLDPDALNRLKRDQSAWIARRDACGVRDDCLLQSYRQRAALLRGGDASAPLAGVFDARQVGTLALFPLDGQYLLAVQTQDPASGRWTCELTGQARAVGAVGLRVQIGEFSFDIDTRTLPRLTVPQGKAVSAIAATACGLGGTFAYTYTRHATGH